MSTKKRNKRIQSILQFGLVLGIIFLLNLLGNAFYTQIDLTEEQRFTLTNATKRQLAKLDDVVYVQVLLEGDFPADFKRLQKATIEMLEDFRGESGYMEYEFDDPNQGSKDEINARREELSKDGINPINFQYKDQSGSQSRQLIYPYAIFYFKGRSLAVNLLENDIPGVPDALILNNSVSLLEYKFANAIQKLELDQNNKPPILFTAGHGELGALETADLRTTLSTYYSTGYVILDSLPQIPTDVAALVVAKPTFPFSEKDKFKIDQYVMNGGKVLWLIDPVNVSLDSLRGKNEYFPIDYQLNLDDLLFTYGIRLNPNLALDMRCTQIPQVTGVLGNAPQFENFDYPFHLVAVPRSNHPVVKSLGPINMRYASTLDTTAQLRTPHKKTILLETSENSSIRFLPFKLDFEFLKYDLDPSKFKKQFLPLAMLIEGEFPSAYKNRVTEGMKAGLEEMGTPYQEQSVPTRMIIVADGDMARNPVNRKNNSHGPLGYNEFVNFTFANKDFVVNAIEYLIDDIGVIEARSKEVKLRLLNKAKAEAETSTWQFINLVVPLVLLGLFGLVYNWLRRRRYT